MKKFHWPLQRVLDVTEKRESAARASVAEVNGRIHLTVQAIESRKKLLAELLEQMARLDLVTRIAQQGVWMSSTPGVDQRLGGLERQLKELHGLRDKRMAELVEIRRQRKTYEKLRERANEKYHQELRRQEQKQLDESAAIGFTLRLAGQVQ